MEKVKDFVCGIEIDKDMQLDYDYDYQGKTYHFCSETCRDDFARHPTRYVR